MITVRKIQPEDMPTLTAWAEERGCAFEPVAMSPHGFIADVDGVPTMALWAYLLFDVPIVQIDNLISKPRTRIKCVRECWRELESSVISWIKIINERHGYSYRMLRAFVEPRVAVETEWKVTSTTLNCIRHVI
jgi:hypothetical protein